MVNLPNAEYAALVAERDRLSVTNAGLLAALRGAEKYVANALERHQDAGRLSCVAEAADKLRAVRTAIASQEVAA